MARIKKEVEGEITVFLSLILLLVLALVGTMIEATRVSAARGYADRALEMALDSVFTGYGRTLYDDYHVFFLEDKEGGEEAFINSLNDYMEYTFKPNTELMLPGTDYEIPNVDLWGITTTTTKLLNTVYATDYKGTIYTNQAIEYMKYRTGTEQLEKLMNQMNLMDSTSKTSSVVEEKLKVEESLGELNQYIIQVMELTEGISFSKNGIQYTSLGLLKTESNFIKQLCPQSISSSNLGINNNLVWSSLKNQYINPITLLNQMQDNIKIILENEASLIRLSEQLNQLSEQSQTTEKTSEKEEIEEEIESLLETISQLEDEIEIKITSIRESKTMLTQVSAGIIPKIDEVLQILPKLDKKQKSMVSEVEGFESVLEGSKEEMIEDVYSGMLDDLSYMKQYVGKESSGNEKSIVFRIQQMKPILESNKIILTGFDNLGNIHIMGRGTNWSVLSNEIGLQIKNFEQYQVKQLCFDYSSLKPKSDVANPISSLNKLLSNTTLELVIEDTSTLSKKRISAPDNLYQLQKKTSSSYEGTTNPDTDYKQVLGGVEDQGYSNEITKSFGDYGNASKLRENVEDTGNKLGTTLLWNEYIDSHFKDYISEEQSQINGITALDYEKEYIVASKGTDKENLQATITKLIMVRTILNFIYILGDSQKRDIAYATAAALVGYTCLEPLVRLTQVLILITWSFEEALVDTGAILAGKSIPLLKDHSSFIVRYEELFLMSKSFIQTKIKQIPIDGKGKLDVGYDVYLRLFLLMEGKERQVYRTMDLVQENMRLRYRSNFNINQCIYGIRVNSEWNIPSKFIRLGFVSNLLKKQKDGWIIRRTMDYSY